MLVRVPEDMPERVPEDTPERVSNDMPEVDQKGCQKTYARKNVRNNASRYAR